MATVLCMPTEAEVTQRRLDAELAVVCGHLNALHTRLVDVVAEAIASRSWEGAGVHSPAQWLAWQSGLSPRASSPDRGDRRAARGAATHDVRLRRRAAVGRSGGGRRDAHAGPQRLRGMRAGAVRNRCPTPSSSVEALLPTHTETIRRRQRTAAGAVHRSPRVRRVQRHRRVLPARTGRPGRWRADHACAGRGKGCTVPAGDIEVTWLDALVEIARRSLGSVTITSRRRLYRVIVHLDAEGAWIHNGPAMRKSLADFILCDGEVRPQWSEGGVPINVGRRRHIVPDHTRIAIEDRDRICRHPACSSSNGLEVHHIIHWSGPERGETVTWNLCCLCPAPSRPPSRRVHDPGQRRRTQRTHVPGCSWPGDRTVRPSGVAGHEPSAVASKTVRASHRRTVRVPLAVLQTASGCVRRGQRLARITRRHRGT